MKTVRRHKLPSTQETFFTPWHGVLYSGFLAVVAFLVGSFVLGVRVLQMRVFAFAVPGALYAMYFLALALSGGVLWPTELWAGSILISGAVGVLISYLVLPSAVPVQGNPR